MQSETITFNVFKQENKQTKYLLALRHLLS